MQSRDLGCRAGLALGLILLGAAANAAEPGLNSNRLAIGFGLGLGSARMNGFLGDDYVGATERANPGVSLTGRPRSQMQYGASLSLRYYLPYHLLAEVGGTALYNTSKTTLARQNQSLEWVSHNAVFEVPFLVGGHVAPTRRFVIVGGLGPALHLFPRSFWEFSPGDAGEQFEADAGLGFHVLLGASYFVTRSFALGLETRYRHLQTGALREQDTQQTMTSGDFRQDGSVEPYRLDFSGISLMLNASLFVM